MYCIITGCSHLNKKGSVKRLLIIQNIYYYDPSITIEDPLKYVGASLSCLNAPSAIMGTIERPPTISPFST